MSDLLEVAERLYGLPLDEFTAAREATARELKGTPLRAQVKALRKPSTSAWVVDLLVRRETEQIDQMIAVGSALRSAQEGMDASSLRELSRQRRQLTAALTTRARALARQHGLRVTDQVAEQVEETLTAAMLDPTAAGAVRSGLLVAALRATGLGEVDAAAAVALPDALGFTVGAVEEPAVVLHVVPDPEPDADAAAAAREALAEAESAWAQAQEAGAAATAEAGRRQAAALQAQSELDELRRRLATLEEAAQLADDELADAEDARDDAEQALAEAARLRDVAAAEVRRLRSGGDM